MHRIIFYSPVHFEKWDWRNSVERGIGGSETSHVEMAWRLARRGYTVVSYAPIPDDCPGEWRNTRWLPLEQADFTQDGLWVLYRCPAALDKFDKKPGQQIWLMCQDEDYGSQWTEARAAKIDKVLALCPVHKQHLETKHPMLAGKIHITSNGFKMDLMQQVIADNPGLVRNPKKLIWASSPDRGLRTLLKILNRAREYDPELELHAFYGLDNIKKLIAYSPNHGHYKQFVADLEKELECPGVHWRGRVSQPELYKEWLTSGIFAYPTHFSETFGIVASEAQAMGAIPITNPFWALRDNVQYGIFIPGDPRTNTLIQARYVDAIVRVAANPDAQEIIRKPMMEWAQRKFDWERAVDDWEWQLQGREYVLCRC